MLTHEQQVIIHALRHAPQAEMQLRHALHCKGLHYERTEAELQALVTARLVERDPTPWKLVQWRLTDAGRAL